MLFPPPPHQAKTLHTFLYETKSTDVTVTARGLVNQGSIPSKGKRFFSYKIKESLAWHGTNAASSAVFTMGKAAGS
jgi:hypothetical protein